MSSEWMSTSLGEICTKVFSGGTPTSTNCAYYDGGTIPWLRTKEVNYSRIYDTEEHITELGFENSSVKLVPANSVIVAMYGNGDTAGRVAINKVPLTTNQACCNLVIDASQADYRFVYYYLMGQYKALVDLKNGGAQQNLNGQLIKAFPIAMPSFAEQVEISTLMESLDDRIALLRDTNATLEAIAQALFKSWFVDFDPVRAKLEGRAPKGMDEATAALFPDGFEESALGLVPKGWQTCAFTEAVNVIGGGTPKTSIPEYWGGEIPWFSVVDAPSGTDTFVVDTDKHITEIGLKNCSTKLLPVGTTIISARGTVGRLALVGRDMAMNQSCYGLRGKADDAYFTYFTTCRLVNALKQRSHGSVFDTITRETLASVSVVYPSKREIQTFESTISPVMERIKENLMQAKTLATLRGTLLPRLISGQLRLLDAEAVLEEACA